MPIRQAPFSTKAATFAEATADKPAGRQAKQKIISHLWFDDDAEEAAHFYASIFSGSAVASREGGKNSKVGTVARYGKAAEAISGKPAGSVMTVEFELEGQQFIALNGGPLFKFSEALSFLVNCETQEEVDYFWEKLSEDGEEGPCGWLKDKYGLSWQIVPAALGELMADTDPKKSEKVMAALLQMKKIDIAALQKAYEQA